MVGAGKTACALELAYHQRRSPRFRYFVWQEAPKEDRDIEGALSRFALDMEKQLQGFKMAHLVDRAEDFRDWLPNLSEMLEQNSILIVLDNLENLLTSDGGWKDERWSWLVEALLEHEGLSRVILTSRRLPKELGENKRLIIEPINALSLSEASLLARETPHLGRLLLGKSPLALEKGRELVKRTLSLVQGHPKLIELADAQAVDPAALEKYLDSALGAWNDSESNLDRFFQDGESARTAEEFLQILTRWTLDVTGSLPKGAKMLFQFLCALEDDDRQEWIVKSVWPELWKAQDLGKVVPGLKHVFGPVKSAGLVDPQVLGERVKYAIHPGVAQASLEEVDDTFRMAVDSMMASFWRAVFDDALSGGSQEEGQWVISAGLRSAPYLIRQERWSDASYLMEEAFYRDASPETIASVLPLLRYIAKATMGTDRELIESAVLANALLKAGHRQEAEDILRSLIPKCVEKREFKSASVGQAGLFHILLQTGQYEEALKLVEGKKAYTRQAGLGPWSQLLDEGRRLQALNSLGRYDEVLKAVEDLRVQMRSLPEKSDQDESVEPWNVRETILGCGQCAAMRSERNELALEFNAEIMDSKKFRGATDLDLVMASYSDYFPLLNLKRYDEAESLLRTCKDVYERERSIDGLGKVFSALANVMDRKGQVDQAVSFEETALRYKYRSGDPESISTSHHNLAIYLSEAGSKSILDHLMAAAVISYKSGSGLLAKGLRSLAVGLDKFGPETLPGSFDHLIDRVERVEGVRFRELCERLPKRAEDGNQLLKKLVDMAQGASP
jgi:tetratricopeptide (TPR) repeat protein